MPTLGAGHSTMVMTDFAVNPQVDARQFDTTVPEGYRRNEMVAAIAQELAQSKGEDHVIAALRGYAERTDGHFPKRLDDWSAFVSLIKGDANGKPSEKDTAFMAHVGSIGPWAFSLPKNGYAYLGDGVTLGEKDKIVFWYQDPTTKKYSAIYGDLSVREAQLETL